MGNKRREAVKRLSRLKIINGPLACVVQPKLNTYFISHCPYSGCLPYLKSRLKLYV